MSSTANLTEEIESLTRFPRKTLVRMLTDRGIPVNEQGKRELAEMLADYCRKQVH